jgi:uncharacterized membrane protein
MYQILKASHSHFAWLVLFALILIVALAIMAFFSKKPWQSTQIKWALIGLILSHIQLLIGLVLYFTSPNGISNLSGETMKDSFARLLAVEHPFINILAIILISIGYSKAKKAVGTIGATKSIAFFYGIGLLLILSRIPWQVWIK